MKNVARRNALRECGLPIGQMNIVLHDKGAPQNVTKFETVSFYCTKDKNHLDECEFVGVELVVKRRRRG